MKTRRENDYGGLMTEESSPAPRIVVAEDDPDVHGLLELLLASAGYEVEMVRDGVSALSALDGEADTALLILDVAMPGDLDGLATTREVRAGDAHASLPILLLSARSQPADVEAGMSSGASDYVIKPFDADVLLTRIGLLIPRTDPDLPPRGTAPR